MNSTPPNYLNDIYGFVTNNILNLRLCADKADVISVGAAIQRSKLTRFFTTSVLNHNITPSHTAHNLDFTFDSVFV